MVEAQAKWTIPEEEKRTAAIDVTVWYDAAGEVDLISVAGTQGRQTFTPRQFRELREIIDKHAKVFE